MLVDHGFEWEYDPLSNQISVPEAPLLFLFDYFIAEAERGSDFCTNG